MKHEHIVELRDFVWDEHYIYLVMEYCSGGDLSKFIKKKKVLPEFVAKYCLQQIASALKFLRENNVSHLDLKPQNILLSSKTSPVLKASISIFINDNVIIVSDEISQQNTCIIILTSYSDTP